MRISDWSSDVCSSDRAGGGGRLAPVHGHPLSPRSAGVNSPTGRRIDRGRRKSPCPPNTTSPSLSAASAGRATPAAPPKRRRPSPHPDRKSVVLGKSVSVSVDLVGRHSIKKKKN